jgi:hypothetical protein
MGALDLPAAASGDRVWDWLTTLNGFGPRLTGSAAHQRAVDFIASELAAIGLEVTRDRQRFTRWEAQRWDLRVAGGREALPVASCFPYSGATGPAGVEGALVPCGGSARALAAAAGGIALVDVRAAPIVRALMPRMFRPRSRVPHDAGFTLPLASPLLGLAALPELAAAARAGARGVVCIWRGCSAENVAHQVLPFHLPLAGCPALWVDEATGERLHEAARHRARGVLTLEATVERDAATDSLTAVLPGARDDESIIVNTHTDGPNACQENGAVGLLALARRFARLPRAQRRRTIVFAFVTGHFQLPQLAREGQATSTWLAQHPELWDGRPGHRRAVAGLTLEHLGAMEWKDDAAAVAYGPTGQPELELVYTGNAALDRLYCAALAGRTRTRTVTLRPANDVYLGEGEPLYRAGIPTISLVPLPDYLCAAMPGGGIERLDRQLLREQIDSFARVLAAIDASDTAALGGPQPQPRSLLRALIRRLRPR